uniref:tRNA-5-taurinomethyluridine 2-sulfurtransferase n=1 Tax=Sinocyclocheilus anshuiensis TaxID=1608454 RepID=A0A671QZ42_9TELE
MATGHYARTSQEDKEVFQQKHIPPSRTLFRDRFEIRKRKCPCDVEDREINSGLTKDFVKKIAAEAGFQHVLKKKESMGICFIGERDFDNFILEYIERKPGSFVSIDDGKIMGQHKGWFTLTLGQRARIGGQVDPWFVVYKDIATGDVFVVSYIIYFAKKRAQMTFQKQVILISTSHFFSAPCTVTLNLDGSLLVMLKEPIRALTPGQVIQKYLHRCRMYLNV